MKVLVLAILVFLLYYPFLSSGPIRKKFEVNEKLLMKMSFLFFVTALSVAVGEIHG